jgi:hypothetical protein
LVGSHFGYQVCEPHVQNFKLFFKKSKNGIDNCTLARTGPGNGTGPKTRCIQVLVLECFYLKKLFSFLVLFVKKICLFGVRHVASLRRKKFKVLNKNNDILLNNNLGVMSSGLGFRHVILIFKHDLIM